jgi:hypothetical protein
MIILFKVWPWSVPDETCADDEDCATCTRNLSIYILKIVNHKKKPMKIHEHSEWNEQEWNTILGSLTVFVMSLIWDVKIKQ